MHDRTVSTHDSPHSLHWRKSSFSGPSNDCVEVADLPDGGVGVRDSKHPAGPSLTFTASEWRAFLRGVHNGEFNRAR